MLPSFANSFPPAEVGVSRGGWGQETSVFYLHCRQHALADKPPMCSYCVCSCAKVIIVQLTCASKGAGCTSQLQCAWLPPLIHAQPLQVCPENGVRCFVKEHDTFQPSEHATLLALEDWTSDVK